MACVEEIQVDVSFALILTRSCDMDQAENMNPGYTLPYISF